jgi:hypothetical protein
VASASVAQTIRVWSSGTVSSQAPRRFISTRMVISIMRTRQSAREETPDTSSSHLSWFEAIVVLSRVGRIGGRPLVSLWETTVVTTSTSLGAEGALAPIAGSDEATGPSINSHSRLARSYDGPESRSSGTPSLETQISVRPSAVQVGRALDHRQRRLGALAVIWWYRRTTTDPGTGQHVARAGAVNHARRDQSKAAPTVRDGDTSRRSAVSRRSGRASARTRPALNAVPAPACDGSVCGAIRPCAWRDPASLRSPRS